MVNREELRARLKEFLGAETYLRFIAALHRQGRTRLRFWQQDAWDEFVVENPECEVATDELIVALKLCQLHEVELYEVEVPVCRYAIDFDPAYERDMIARFPHATPPLVMVPESYAEETVRRWVCATCNEVLSASRWHRGEHPPRP